MAPVLYDMLSPLIEATIATTVKLAIGQIKTTVLDEMIKSNDELKIMVTDQSKTINSQKEVIENQSKMLADKIERTEQLELNVEYLMMEMDSMKMGMNNLEQCGRRNSLRINNYRLLSPPADELDLSYTIAKYLDENILYDTKPLETRDIERCHFVGRAKPGRPKQIIVKFWHYQDKKRVFAGKSKLKSNPDKIFLTEDLTTVNHSVVQRLLPLKKSNSIDSFWTNNGHSASDPVKVSASDNLEFKLDLTSGDSTSRGSPSGHSTSA